MSKQKTNPESPVPVPEPEYHPMTGAELRFLRKYFRFSQVKFGKLLGYETRQGYAPLEIMEMVPSGIGVEVTKFIVKTYSEAELQRARALFKSESKKSRDIITQGKKSEKPAQTKHTGSYSLYPGAKK